MCYQFARATRSVSLVPACYYADIICTQARPLVYDLESFDDTTVASGSGRAPSTRAAFDPSSYFWSIEPNGDIIWSLAHSALPWLFVHYSEGPAPHGSEPGFPRCSVVHVVVLIRPPFTSALLRCCCFPPHGSSSSFTFRRTPLFVYLFNGCLSDAILFERNLRSVSLGGHVVLCGCTLDASTCEDRAGDASSSHAPQKVGTTGVAYIARCLLDDRA